jgi:hypothetical protein
MSPVLPASGVRDASLVRSARRGLLFVVAAGIIWCDRAIAQVVRPKESPSDEQERYLPCTSGSASLKQIDAWESAGVTPNIEQFGRSISAERLAEVLIGDCSEQLAKTAAAASVVGNSLLQGVVNAWQTNLDFMKWWLQNRREKKSRR